MKAHFKCGNFKSLKSNNLIDKLKDFYHKHYSSHKMKLVILTNKSTKKLMRSIELFQEIKQNYHDSVPVPFPFPEENCQKCWKIVHVKDKKKLVLQWIIPHNDKDYKCKPHYYMCMLLNHDGEFQLKRTLLNVLF